jgi:hypothetical protein
VSAAGIVHASHAYCWAVKPVSKLASQQEKTFCVLHLEMSRSAITVQGEYRSRFKKYIILVWCVFFTLHCNHGSEHLKTENTESLLLLRRHLGNWSHDPTLSKRDELLVAHEKLGQVLLLAVSHMPVYGEKERNFY